MFSNASKIVFKDEYSSRHLLHRSYHGAASEGKCRLFHILALDSGSARHAIWGNVQVNQTKAKPMTDRPERGGGLQSPNPGNRSSAPRLTKVKIKTNMNVHAHAKVERSRLPRLVCLTGRKRKTQPEVGSAGCEFDVEAVEAGVYVSRNCCNDEEVQLYPRKTAQEDRVKPRHVWFPSATTWGKIGVMLSRG